MKNLKVLSGIFSALLISSIVYFSTSGFITEHNPSDKNKAPSVPCTFLVQVISFEAECLTENYFYCIDGGPAVIATGDFFVDLPCGFHTICVESSSGCSGRITIPVDCPCDDNVQVVTVVLSASNKKCSCSF